MEAQTTFNVTTTKSTLKSNYIFFLWIYVKINIYVYGIVIEIVSNFYKEKTGKDSTLAVKYSEKPIEADDCLVYMNLFKALFCEKEDTEFSYEKSMVQLSKSSVNLLEILHKLLLLSLRNSVKTHKLI